MNKKLSVVMFAGVLMSGAVAQAEPAPVKPLRFGGRIGLNFSSIGGDDVNDSAIKSRTGLWIGGTLVSQMGPNFGIEVSAGYAQKGAKIADGGGSINLDYLELPVLAALSFPATPTVKIRGLAGAAASLRVSAKAKGNGGSEDISDQIKQFELGLVVGAGAEIALSSGALLLDARYELGMTTLDDTSSEADVKHRIFSLNVGFVR